MGENMATPVEKVIEVTGKKGGHLGSLIKIFGQPRRIVIFKDSWYHKPFTLAYPKPWDVPAWGKEKALRNRTDPMIKVNDTFAKISSALKGIDRWQRREAIAKALKGKSFGGRPKKPKAPKVSPEEIARRLAGII